MQELGRRRREGKGGEGEGKEERKGGEGRQGEDEGKEGEKKEGRPGVGGVFAQGTQSWPSSMAARGSFAQPSPPSPSRASVCLAPEGGIREAGRSVWF